MEETLARSWAAGRVASPALGFRAPGVPPAMREWLLLPVPHGAGKVPHLKSGLGKGQGPPLPRGAEESLGPGEGGAPSSAAAWGSQLGPESPTGRVLQAAFRGNARFSAELWASPFPCISFHPVAPTRATLVPKSMFFTSELAFSA